MRVQRNEDPVQVAVGFADDGCGSGVAYATVKGTGRGSPLRVGFAVERAATGQGREVGYAALRAVAAAIRERTAGAVLFLVADEALAMDLNERRPLPGVLTMPYVALRCALNRFDDASVAYSRGAEISDLSARAQAEVFLHVAA